MGHRGGAAMASIVGSVRCVGVACRGVSSGVDGSGCLDGVRASVAAAQAGHQRGLRLARHDLLVVAAGSERHVVLVVVVVVDGGLGFLE